MIICSYSVKAEVMINKFYSVTLVKLLVIKYENFNQTECEPYVGPTVFVLNGAWIWYTGKI